MADGALPVWVVAALAAAMAFGWHSFGRGAPLAERLFLAAAGGYLLLSHAGVVLSEAGWFGIRALALVAIAAATASWLWRSSRPRFVSPSGVDSVGLLVLPVLAALTFWFSSPPFDTRLDARDQGVNRLTASQLLRSGTLAFEDPLVVEMSTEAREYFFRQRVESRSRSMGFYLDDIETGRVVPQFLPVGPVWLTIGRAGLGSTDAGYVVVGVAILAAAALFFLGRALANGLAGVLASVWLCMSFANSWFVRYGSAEVHAQAMILIGCFALLRERGGDQRTMGLMAGWAFGLIWLTKLELWTLVVPLGLIYVADVLSGRLRTVSTRWFWAGSLTVGVHGFVHLWFWSLPYVLDVLYGPPKKPFWMLTLAMAVAATAAVAVGARSIRTPLVPLALVAGALDPLSRSGRLLRGVLAAAFTAAVSYAYFVRPETESWDAHNFILVIWLVSSVATLVAVFAVLLAVLRPSPRPGFGAVVTILVVASAVLLWRKNIIPELLWAYRRYLPVVLPTTLAAAAGLLGVLAERAWTRLRRPPRGAVPMIAAAMVIAVVATTAGWITWRSWTYATRYAATRDLEGGSQMMQTLAAALPPDAVVLLEANTRRGLPRFENAIQHELGLGMLRLPEPELSREIVLGFVRDQVARGRGVYLLTTGYIEAVDWLRADPVEAFLWEGSRLQETTSADNRLPVETEPVVINAKLYRLRPGAPAPLNGALDVGGWDDLYLAGRTLENIEGRRGERSYRWTRPVGRFVLPGIDETDEELIITLAGGYPPDLGEQRITVRLDGIDAATVVVHRGFRDYSFPVPPEWSPTDRPAVLEIETTPPLRPAETDGSSDSRTLGVAVDRIRWGPRNLP